MFGSYLLLLYFKFVNYSLLLMTKAEIVKKIHVRTSIHRTAVTLIVEQLMETIKTEMSHGNNIYLRGFGTFVIRRHAPKKVFDINKGEFYDLPEHTLPAFKPGKDLMKHTYKLQK